MRVKRCRDRDSDHTWHPRVLLDVWDDDSDKEGRTKAVLNFFHDNGKFEATHEIDIPDGAHTMTVQSRGNCNTLPAQQFPIPRPKVRRWQWVKDYGGSEAKMEIRSTERYTRQELDAVLLRNNLNTYGWYHDNSTMVEADS